MIPSAARDLPGRVLRPLQQFLQTETAGAVLLLVATAAALAWINLPGGARYEDFWGAHLRLDLNVASIDESLRHWINDGLMTLFFFVVGLEIKRELVEGELAGARRAALPAIAALGGMAAPAAIYASINAGRTGADGWGIPMATDIAFAVGVFALFGARAPGALKVFLLALAIVDDIGAIIVIAVFYSGGIAPGWLAAAAGLLALVALLPRFGVREPVAYIALGLATWFATYQSGVHATVAGVALALLVPVRPPGDLADVARRAEELAHPPEAAPGEPSRERVVEAIDEIRELAGEHEPPLDRIERRLHPWTSYLIVPLFALANAGVPLGADALADAARSAVAWGVALGLVLGKPLGILLCSWGAVRLRIAALPDGVGWAELAGAALIAGIGFTVSLFITGLAFGEDARAADAKIAILLASALMGVVGMAVLWMVTRAPAERA